MEYGSSASENDKLPRPPKDVQFMSRSPSPSPSPSPPLSEPPKSAVFDAPPASPSSVHNTDGTTHKRSWSGSFTEMASDFLAASGSSNSKPPPVPRQKSVEEERQTFHDRSRKFLEQAERERARMLPPPIPLPRSSSPSVAKNRKRLESIEEDQTPNNVLLLQQQQQKQQSQTQQQHHHVRIHSDEVSALSNGSFASWLSRDSTLSRNQLEQIAHFEQRQQAQFDETKEVIGRKLFQTLDRNDSIPSEKEKQEFIEDYLEELERERVTLIAQWKAELEAERERLDPPLSETLFKMFFEPCLDSFTSFLATLEVFIANLPLTIGAVGLSWVTMGTVWFKFMEENVGFCVPVHFYSPQCTFPEYPGCFECDTSEPLYRLVVSFHVACNFFAGACCVLFLLKILIAWKVVADELSNPTTSTPMGVSCIAVVCVFAGRGTIGGSIVIVTSIFHFFLSFWFLYMAIYKYGLFPDPGWFPSTVGITYAAVKTWLYFPVAGLILLAFAVLFFFALFFVSVVRVALNKKIAAPVAWIGLSAPSITMYALTLVAQPTPYKEALLEENSVLRLQNHDWMVQYYLPFQHFMMILSLIGLASAVHALVTRWEAFSKKPFSPAHVAFCFPTLSHTNAIQAYRGAVNSFSTLAPNSPFKTALYFYWVAFLLAGTALNLLFTYMYIVRLPQWTKLDTAGESEPPAPSDTFVHEMMEGSGVRERLAQPFTSPAVLEANEAGVLVRVRRGTEDYRIHGPYVRTRQVMALGFDPTMDDDELRRERAELMDWVAKNAPRARNRTMSNPLILNKPIGARTSTSGTDSSNLYGTFAAEQGGSRRHNRSVTTTGLPWL